MKTPLIPQLGQTSTTPHLNIHPNPLEEGFTQMCGDLGGQVRHGSGGTGGARFPVEAPPELRQSSPCGA